ncbi:Homocysteine biosynthesis enzyme, sulfur-incorporation [uncultured archaeon]|nr:Homocysteine biosynthesis enzyme, sulfur-incorporation [uncultured archaeon]
MVKSYSEILDRVKRHSAVVLTAEEVSRLAERGETSALEQVDVVTTATRAVMSGTYAVLSFPVAGPGEFLRAKKVFINGIEANVGPCPNENLGVLDVVIFGTAHSRSRPNYGGGHLFRELVEGKKVQVEVETDAGKALQAEVGLEDMPHARLFGSRHAFKNYSAFINPSERSVRTIFHAREFEPGCREATFSGCGQINPLKNDPLLETIGMGTRILLNGAEGFVLGTGTRSTPERPNLSGFADMHQMLPEYMGGFVTSAGPECIVSWAVPIPVASETVLQEIVRQDSQIPLPVMDVVTRNAIGKSDYGCVWRDVDLEVEFDAGECRGCTCCQVEMTCPMKAVRFGERSAKRDEMLCFHCGLCVTQCPSAAFRCRLGSIQLKTPSGDDRCIPVVLRQSDRLRAIKLAEELKRRILEGSFKMAQPLERIS